MITTNLDIPAFLVWWFSGARSETKFCYFPLMPLRRALRLAPATGCQGPNLGVKLTRLLEWGTPFWPWVCLGVATYQALNRCETKRTIQLQGLEYLHYVQIWISSSMLRCSRVDQKNSTPSIIESKLLWSHGPTMANTMDAFEKKNMFRPCAEMFLLPPWQLWNSYQEI